LVKIRLKRMGTTKRPFYRLVVADSRSPRDGRFIEALGFYDPLPRPASVRIDEERVREWLRRGARPSDSARDLLVAQGILAGDPRRAARPLEVVAGDGTAAEETAGTAADSDAGGAVEPAAGASAAVDPAGEAAPSAETAPEAAVASGDASEAAPAPGEPGASGEGE